MANPSLILSPTETQDRILSLDVLRGFAVLGILIMNIQSFAMPSFAYVNPTVYENLSGIHLNVYLASHIFASQKFMAIFSIMFGASIIMLSNRAKKEHVRSGDLQKRRLFWLLVIGLIHAYLVWYGDILAPYAICGFFMFIFRRKKTKTLFRAGIIFLSIGSLIGLLIGYTIPFWEAGELQNVIENTWLPTPEIINQEVEAYRSNWERQLFFRAGQAFEMQTTVFVTETFWRISGLMLIGMAFYKQKVLTAKKSKKHYSKMIIYGLGLGLPLVVGGTIINFATDWTFELSFFYISQFNYWGSVLMAIGYIGIVMLAIKVSREGLLTRTLSNVGRLALTNYLLQSIICSIIFYGHGFGFFGDIDRAAQAFAVLGIWVFLMLFSTLWLKYFNFGPFEWLWRSLTYGKLQPLAKED